MPHLGHKKPFSYAFAFAFAFPFTFAFAFPFALHLPSEIDKSRFEAAFKR